ncbi:MAG: HAMP domain-containing histidine kinase [Agathobacter sp.]|nr:HAMP domain-containing histidine kinase [Agathobacter sp.]
MKKNLMRWFSRFGMGIALFSFIVIVNFVLFFSYEQQGNFKGDYGTLIIIGNIVFLAVIFTIADSVYHYVTVKKPMKRIQKELDKVVAGDFSVRIDYIKGKDSGNEIDEVITLLNDMIQELSGVETLRTDFIANVSHELKTPMAVMQNYGTLLQANEMSDDTRIEYGRAIAEQTRRLSALVTNILKLNKLENQQIYPNTETYDIGEQLCECMLEHEAVWEEKGIEIEADMQEELLVEADKELLSLVWNNLFSNALKFTEKGGTVSLRSYGDETFVYVEVKDTGCGMSPETGANIFKKFYQGDTSHSTKGNGLGLALVKRVMDICKGEISVSSQLGKGSTFTVRLNRVKEE